MNERIENIIISNTVRLSDQNGSCIGSGVVIKSPSVNKHYLLTAKHCFPNFNEEKVISFKMEFWNKSTGTFSGHFFNVSKFKIVHDVESLEDDIILFAIVLNELLPNIAKINLATGIPHLQEKFIIAGFPNGSKNRFKTISCEYDSSTLKTLFTQISAGLLETNDTSANANTDNFSGSGIWFEYANSIYLTAVVSEFCAGNPVFESYRIQRLIDLQLVDDLNFTDLSLPKNDIQTNKNLSQSSELDGDNVLSFWREYSTFIGRKEEIDILEKFINDDRKLLGVTVSGMGGVGKSRLLIEFDNHLDRKQWEVHYIDNFDSTTKDRFRKVVNDLIIVIDQEKVKVDDIIGLVKDLRTNSNNQKIRIIMIGRDAKAQLIELKSLSIEYKHFDDIELEGLSPDEYVAVIQDIVKSRNETLTIEVEALQSIQSNLDEFRRPIFAILIAIAVSDGEDIHEWGVNDLLNHYYIVEKHKLKAIFDNTENFEKHLNFIAVLFVIGEPNDGFILHVLNQTKSWLPNLDSVRKSFIQNFLLINNSTNRYFKLYPDILSSFFVLKRFEYLCKEEWNGFKEIESILKILIAESHNVKELEIIASPTNPIFGCVYRFKRLIIQDFPNHELTSKIIKTNISEHTSFELEGYSQFIVKLISYWGLKDASRVNSYENLLKQITINNNPSSIKSLMEGYCFRITNGLEPDEYYRMIRNESVKCEEEPWTGQFNFLDPNTPPLLGEMYLETERLYKMSQDKTLYSVIWAAIPKIEADSISYMLNNNINLKEYTSVQLLQRLEFLQRHWTDPRIKISYLEVIVKSNTMHNVKKLALLEKILYESLRIPEQIREIQVATCIAKLHYLACWFFMECEAFDSFKKHFSNCINYMYNLEVERYNRGGIAYFLNVSSILYNELLIRDPPTSHFVKECILRLEFYFENTFLKALTYD